MLSKIVDHRSTIKDELQRRNLSVTPQALNTLVSTVENASPEIAGDSDSLLLGLLTTGSYTVDVLEDSGADISEIFESAKASAAHYNSPVSTEDLNPIEALFGEQAIIASLFERAEFRERPIEASDILQQAITPVTPLYTGYYWLDEDEVRSIEDPSRLRIYSDIELLVKETVHELLESIWKNPRRVLKERRIPLRHDEIMPLRKRYHLEEPFLSCVINSLNEFILTNALPFGNSQFVEFAARVSYKTSLGGEHFVSSGGDYNALASSLRTSARFAPERDQPILALAEQDGRIVVRHFTYRGTGAVNAELSNQLLSVSSQSFLPLIHNQVLEEFEEIINRPLTREQDIQFFLESHTEIINSLGYSHCLPHVVLSEPGKSDLIPDFILHRPGGGGFDILDLKLPQARIAVNSPYLRISHEISKALAQLRAYRNYFKNPVNRDKFIRTHQIEYFEPKLIVAIGRQAQYLTSAMREEIEEQVQGVRILTYDELVAYAKTRTIRL
jgi:rRNA-processing protein FCF1